MSDYHFVVSGGQPKPASRAVRSHAMKVALHRRATQADKKDRLDENPQPANASFAEEGRQGGLTGRFRLVTRPKMKQRKQQNRIELVVENSLDRTVSSNGTTVRSSPPMQAQQQSGSTSKALLDPIFRAPSPMSANELSNSHIDPFDSICVPCRPQVDVLIKYCKISHPQPASVYWHACSYMQF